VFMRLRGLIIRPFFKKCGKRLGVGRNVVFYNPSKISIGDDVYIAYGCWFAAGDCISVEDEVIFGPYNVVASSNHTRMNGSFRFGEGAFGEIVFQRGVWMSSHCTTTAGSTVKEGSLVAANTVVRGIVEKDVLYAGDSLGYVRKNF
jgi:acetyltransferase-like isoleucine patch superfamily enzyme